MTSKNSHHGFTPKSTYAEVFERTGSGGGDGIGPYSISKWCQHCASKPRWEANENPSLDLRLRCALEVFFFNDKPWAYSENSECYSIKIHPHPSKQHPFDGKTDFPKPEVSSVMKPGHSTSQLSCWLWRKVITWILRHKPRLDTEQFLPLWWLWPKGYQNSLGMPHPAPGWNLGVHKERQSECDKAPASIQCESAAPHFAGKMKIWRVLVQWWSGKLCLKSQILVRWSQKCIQWLKLQVCPKMPSGQNRQAWKSRSGPLRSTMQWTESVSPMLGRQLGSLCRL